MISLRLNSNKRPAAPNVSSKHKQKMSANVNNPRVVRKSSARRKRQSTQDGSYDVHVVTCSEESMSERGAFQGTPRKRGHQHHPRNHGSRRKQPHSTDKPIKVENTCNLPAVALANNCDNTKSVCDNNVEARIVDNSNIVNNNENTSITNNNRIEHKDVRDQVPQKNTKSRRPSKSYKDIPRPAAEGSSQSDVENEDPEQAELAKLRCTSERTEVVAERETRRRNRRCADYPGLAFGSSIFSSDTMMKFSIIRNELHNIMNTQLKRVRQ